MSGSALSPSPSPTPGTAAAAGQGKLPPLPSDLVLPPLPNIPDKGLERLAFTHSSYNARQKDRNSLDLRTGIGDNEKLEHVGDSLLGCIVTLLLHQLYPNLMDGTATILKAHLVSNATLAQITSRYSLQKHFIAAPATMFSIQTGEKTRANLFEAYIAALYAAIVKERHALSTGNRMVTPPLTPLEEAEIKGSAPDPLSTPVPAMDDGVAFAIVSGWLRGVFTPIAAWAFEQMKEQRRQATISNGGGDGEDDSVLDEKAMGRTAQLNEYFTKFHGKKPDYHPSSNEETGLWTIECVAVTKGGTRFTAIATRASKKAASQVAAWKICEQLGWE